MTKYVHFDVNTGCILNWMDTKALCYSAMPNKNCLLEITDQQYKNRNVEKFMVKNGELVPYVAAIIEPPSPDDILKIQRLTMQVTSYQFKAELLFVHHIEDLVAPHVGIETEQRAIYAWHISPVFNRTGITVKYMLDTMGISEVEMDDIFIKAKLRVA